MKNNEQQTNLLAAIASLVFTTVIIAFVYTIAYMVAIAVTNLVYNTISALRPTMRRKVRRGREFLNVRRAA